MIFLVQRITNNYGIIGTEKNPSGIKRFSVSPLLHTLIRFKTTRKKFTNYDPQSLIIDEFKNRKKYRNYIIASGVTHSPNDWTGYKDLGKVYDRYAASRKSVLTHLLPKQLRDLQKNKCFLLLDQTHEGYHTPWLFDWFHDNCEKYNVSPSRIIYVTGNLAVEDQYKKYCIEKQIRDKIFVVPHIQFAEFIYDSAVKAEKQLPTFKEHMDYKLKNEILTYNCFQKRNRPHRVWMFYYLYKNNLLNKGINSMNDFTLGHSYYDGRSLDQNAYDKIKDLVPMYPRQLNEHLKDSFKGPLGHDFERDLYVKEVRDTWISVVSEASFAEDTCFISEKSFKPIAARHPFIMCGNKNSLNYLKSYGYKTFDGIIDESYDELDTWNRYDMIIKNILKLDAMTKEQKLEWYRSLEDTLEHNYETLRKNSTEVLPEAVLKIENYVGGI